MRAPRRLSHSLLAVALLSGGSALGQEPPVPVNGQQVSMPWMAAEVRIVDGVATTTLHQTLHNRGTAPAEAIWLLPLPVDAVADRFSMTAGGVQMISDVLDADSAREVYESIVHRRRDPGLLEYVGRGCLRARVFPIPPGGDVEVEITFRQILPVLGGLSRWSFPLDAAGLEGRPPERVALHLLIDSKRPLRNVFSPSPGVQVVMAGDHRARATFEGGRGELRSGELTVFYGLSEEEFGLDLLSYRERTQDRGAFMMMISPKWEWEDERILGKHITFVLDVSGSMRGRKLGQARNALRLFLSSLQPGDLFNVIPFSTKPKPFFDRALPATPANVGRARRKVLGLHAGGETNIADALQLGLPPADDSSGRVPITVFLTDGLPTVGTRDPKAILEAVREENTSGAGIFVFGVGNDVNTFLLDKLAEENGGTRDYVNETEDIAEKTSALFGAISRPVLTDLQLDVEGIELSAMVPARLPDLFQGQRLLLFGRYRGVGTRAIRLSGRARGERREYVYEGFFSRIPEPEHDFVPALWAQRRVAVLLDAIRLDGMEGELYDEVVRLGRKYNIVTPYTSHLIVEEGFRIASGASNAGPSTPGPSGPASPGPAAPGAARVSAPRGLEDAETDRLVDLLRRAGVLPGNASREELQRLAVEIAREIRASSEALDGLGRESSGERAVSDSAYLAKRIAGATSTTSGSEDLSPGDAASSPQRKLFELFTRQVANKVFLLRQGIWTDREYDERGMARRKQTVEAYSDEYFALVREVRGLAPYLALSDRLVVVIGERVIEIAPVARDRGD